MIHRLAKLINGSLLITATYYAVTCPCTEYITCHANIYYPCLIGALIFPLIYNSNYNIYT